MYVEFLILLYESIQIIYQPANSNELNFLTGIGEYCKITKNITYLQLSKILEYWNIHEAIQIQKGKKRGITNIMSMPRSNWSGAPTFT